MRTNRQTDMTNLIVSFRNFANAPKMQPFPFNALVAVTSWYSFLCYVGVSTRRLLDNLIRPLAPKLIRNDLLNDEVKLDLLVVRIFRPPMHRKDS